MEQITRELRQRIFALYIGSEIQAPDPYETKDLEKGFLTGIHGEYGAEIQFIVDGNAEETPAYEEFEKCQLILKPLSEITDEDAIEVAKVIYPMTSGWHVKRAGLSVRIWTLGYAVDISISGMPNIVAAQTGEYDHVSTEDIIYITDYLRSKSYAIPYLGIDLFESGIAVKP